LRERGVTLIGPSPAALVDEVGANILRAVMRQYAESFLPDLFTWINFGIAWAQRYAVATLSRILYTLETGEVTSKRDAMLWAVDHLDAEWRPSILQSLADRSHGWNPEEASRPGLAVATVAFAEYAKQLAVSIQKGD